MKHLPQLYYQEKNTAVHYSSIPQGILDVFRMVQGKSAYWQKLTPENQIKQKNIVFADWSITSWSTRKKHLVLEGFQRLLDEGFNLFIWRNNQVVKLTDLDWFDNPTGEVTPAFCDAILASGTRPHKLTCDNTYIIDDYQQNLLIGYSLDAKRQLNACDFFDQSKENQSKIKKILQHANPPVEALLIDRLTADIAEKRTLAQTIWPTLALVERYETLCCSFSGKLLPSTHQLEEMSRVFTQGNMAEMVSLNINRIEPAFRSMLEKIIQFQTPVYELNAESTPFTYLQPLNLTQLRSLSLKKVDYLNASFVYLLPQLSVLCLEFCRLELPPEQLQLNNLHTLVLDSSDTNLETCNMLFKAAPNLKSLVWAGHDRQIADDEIFEPFHFQHLTHLKLKNVETSESQLHDLLKPSAATLTYLDLSSNNFYCPTTDTEFDYQWPNDFIFERLERFQVSGGHSSGGYVEYPRILKHIIQQAPHLKSINFNEIHCSNSYETQDWLAECSLPELEAFDIGNAESFTIAIENLNQFLSQVRALKTLKLSKYNQFTVPLEGNFEQLQTLDISNTLITIDILKLMLKRMPSLKCLNVEQCRDVVIDEELQGLFNKIDKVMQAPKIMNCRILGMNKHMIELYKDKNVVFVEEHYQFQLLASGSGINKPQENTLRSTGGDVEPSQRNAPNNNNSIQPKILDRQSSVDADTTFKEKTFNLQRIFFSPFDEHHPQLEHYRTQTFDSIMLTPNLTPGKSPFLLSNTADVDLHPVEIKQEADDVIRFASKKSIYGKQQLLLNSQWQAIASLQPIEKMTHVHVEPKVDIEIQYSVRDNLYYIRSTNTTLVSLDFLIEPSPFKLLELTPEIQAIVNGFRSFQTKSLILNHPNPQSIDYLNAILTQKVGACRHRAAAFKLHLQHHYPHIPVRIVSNGCHMFVEIKQGDTWISTDLGGYAAKMNIDESLSPIQSHGSHAKQDVLAKDTPTELEYLSERDKQFQHLFETWNKTSNKPQATSTAFIHALMHDHTKHLIQLSHVHIPSLNITLQAYAKDNHHPVFYVNSPDDLICSAPFVKRLPNNEGMVVDGPGGALYDFLTTARNANAPLLIVNYANFLADDIVRFNSLLDNTCMADGTEVPANTRILGLIDPNKPGSYQGGDFYSRFQAVHQYPTELIQPLAPVLTLRPDTPVASTIINLHHSMAWETVLLGGWTLKAGRLYFEPGELVQALEKGLPIEIQNPPVDAAFDLFWQQARLHQSIQINGQTIAFDERQAVFYSDGYNWRDLLQRITWSESPTPSAQRLNPTLLNRFISNYQFNDGQLSKCPGILQANSHGQVSLFVTASLSEDQWGILLEESRRYDVQLSIACAPDVLLPSDFPQIILSHHPELPAFDPTALAKTQSIQSDDCDLTIAVLQSHSYDEPWIVIDVSELAVTDLLKKIDGKLLKKTQHSEDSQCVYDFQFTETSSVLLKTLNENKKVILTGQFSNELLDSLAPVLFERMLDANATGQLVLVQDKPIGFLGGMVHDSAPEDKQHALINAGFTDNELIRIEQENPNYLIDYDFNTLKTRLIFLKKYPLKHSNDAWLGLETLPSEITLTAFNPKKSEQITHNFIARRQIAVLDALQLSHGKPCRALSASSSSPYVFLAGLTGVGKTTFVEEMFTQNNAILFQSEQNIINWANHVGSENKILFIDEANLSMTQWTQFEGLFHEPPNVIIDGQRHVLTNQHKVIFAGNPLSYGDERQVGRLFKRHGNALVFDPLPTAFIYEKIIKPIFENSELNNDNIIQISQNLLAVYQFVTECSRDEVLISPREVQMMALLVNQYLTQHVHLNDEEKGRVAQYYAKSIAVSLVPEMHLARFNQQFPDVVITRTPIVSKSNKASLFVNTPSRNETLYKLHDFVCLQALRRHNTVLNDAQAYGGLGGLILEGEPGIGKSEMVIDYLVGQGIHQADLTTKKAYDQQMFYRIPVSMEFNVKKRLLLKAFDEGAIVIVDEINSAPMMEQLLNSLLMGKNPEGGRPTCAGFSLIGTQNPATMAGRRTNSSALARRMQTCCLSPYTKTEMIQILQHKGVPTQVAEELLRAFQTKEQQAKKEHLKPAPTFRNLMNIADDWVTAHGKVPLSKIADNAPITFTLLPDPYRLTDEQILAFEQQFDTILSDFSIKLNMLPLDTHLQTCMLGLNDNLLEKKKAFLSAPRVENFQRFKEESIELINRTEKISQFNHILYTTPVLRELTMLLNGLKKLIQLLILKPVYVISGETKPVFKHGLYAAFFLPPKTDVSEEAEQLKQRIDKMDNQHKM